MKKNLARVGIPVLALIVCGIIILLERNGISQKEIQDVDSTEVVEESITYSEPIEVPKECLLLVDSSVQDSQKYQKIMTFILDSMSVGYDVVDLKTQKFPALENYQTVVLGVTDLVYLKENISTLSEWVQKGGSLMSAYTFKTGRYFHLLSGKLGIIDGGNDFATYSGIEVKDGFMIGGGRSFHYESDWDSSLNVILDDSCQVYLKAANNTTPILWEKDYGDGKFVVVNLKEYEKVNRGILSAAYSLLQDAFIYPVINASAFYIDDFLAPTPSEKNKYITKYYHSSIKDFYLDYWFPTILQWEKSYGIIHTGTIVESYSKKNTGPFKRQDEVELFEFYGNMLLKNGGELGLHGYNHMPLCLEGFNYSFFYDEYKVWKDKETMKASLEELISFSKELFPTQKLSVYVPPANVLSQEGREMIGNEFPEIKAIASVYRQTKYGSEYTQEFSVSEDGIIETPRIISGYLIDGSMEFEAFSELNFHYVQSSYSHPSDVLDEEKGSELGWETQSNDFEQYISWIYDIAPNIRDVTGSQMGRAVEQYDKLQVQKTYSNQGINLELGSFSKEAYLMLRLNEGKLATIEGGECENITGNLYLIHALQDEIKITWTNQ